MAFLKKKENKAFTLVEMMAVIAIIAILFSIIIVSINRARIRTKNVIVKSNLEQIEAIAKTTYNPEIDYKELYNMRGEPSKMERDYKTLKEIRRRISEVGTTGILYFPKDGDTGEYEAYCAFARLFPRESNVPMSTVFCIDSEGRRTEAVYEEINCTDMALPTNCEKRP